MKDSSEDAPDSVVIRQKFSKIAQAVKSLQKVEGLSVQDEQDASAMTELVAKIDRRHQVELGFAPVSELPRNRRALAADCLSEAERKLLLKMVEDNNHTPAA
ncbi:MAG: hypothetical protein MI749_02890 [Desulfovibrionales bacterium]|nr:hypothetical protein [Desulfovibrionales bacterium]